MVKKVKVPINQKDRIISKFILIYFIVFPFSVTFLIVKGIAVQFPAEIVLIFLVFLILLGILMPRILIFGKSNLLFLSSIFVFFNLVNVFFSQHILISLKTFSREFIYYFPIVFGMIFFYKEKKNIKKLIFALISIGCIFASWGIIQQLTTGLQTYAILAAPFFTEHATFGVFMAYMLSFTIAFLLYGKSILRRGILIFILILLALALILSFAKASWVSIIGMILFLIVLEYKKLLKPGKILVFSIIITVLVGFSFYKIKGYYKSEDLKLWFSLEYPANQERINRFNAAFKMFINNPLIGVGLGSYSFEYQKYKSIKYDTDDYLQEMKMGAHNQYLSILAERGLIGFAIFLLLIFGFIKKSIKLYKNYSDDFYKSLILGALLGNITIFIHWLANTLWDYEKTASLFWLCFVIIVIAEIDFNEYKKTKKASL